MTLQDVLFYINKITRLIKCHYNINILLGNLLYGTFPEFVIIFEFVLQYFRCVYLW